MTCHRCQTQAVKFGINAQGFQRFRCKQCNRTFSDVPVRPLDNLRIPFDKAVQIVNMLVEGIGIRAIERLTGVHRDTVLAVLEVAGEKCARLLDQKVRHHPFEFVQVDELFCFVQCKEKRNELHAPDIGEQYVFIGVDAQSKSCLRFQERCRSSFTLPFFSMPGAT